MLRHVSERRLMMTDLTTQRRLAIKRRGLTLIELIVVLSVLVALGGLLVPVFSSVGADAREQATQSTMSRVAAAIVGPEGYAQRMRYARDISDNAVGHASGLPWPSPSEVVGGRADHPQLHYLFVEPAGLPEYDATSRIGWRGPWLDVTGTVPYAVFPPNGFTDAYGEDDDRTPIDGWGIPIVIQLPAVAAGVTDIEVEHVRLVSAGPDGVLDTPANVLTPTSAQKDDDLVLYLFREDPNP